MPPPPGSWRPGGPRSSSPTCRTTRARPWPNEIGGAFCNVDVTNTDDIINAVEMAKSMGPLRVLVNSAGIGWAERTVGKDGQYESAVNLDVVQEGHRDQPRSAPSTASASPPRR